MILATKENYNCLNYHYIQQTNVFGNKVLYWVCIQSFIILYFL